VTKEDISDSHPWRATLGFALLVALLVLAAASKSVLYDTMDPDAFWHLRVAEQLQRDGIGPLVDELSFASVKEPWTPYSWLAELGMKSVWDAGGYRAAVAAQAITVAAFFTFVALACVESCSAPRPYIGIALAVTFAGYVALPYLSFRPVTLAFALLALCAWLVARDRRLDERTPAVWAIVPLTVVLVNVHLFALFVPAWMLAVTIGALRERREVSHWSEQSEVNRRARRYAILTVLCAAACCATPMLPGLLRSLRHLGTRDPMVEASLITELRPFYHGQGGLITMAVLLVAAAVVIRTRWQFRTGEWLCVLLGAAAFVWKGRLAPAFVLSAAPMLAAAMPTLRGRLLGRPVVTAALAAVIGFGGWHVVSSFPAPDLPLAAWLNRHGPDTHGYPCEAANFVATRIEPRQGRIINDFNWGGYLAWQLGPRFQVYMDARTQVYDPDFWNTTCLGSESKLRDALRSVRADAAIVPLPSHRLERSLQSLGWKRAYVDDRASVMLPPDAPLADVR
jgi:hypothetical protein